MLYFSINCLLIVLLYAVDVYDGPRQPVVCRDGSSVNNYMEFSVALDTVKEACFKVSQ